MPISTKRKAPGELAAPIVKPSAKAPSKHTVDESHTSVSGTDALLGTQVESIEISSDEVSDEEIADSEDGMEVDEASAAPQQPAAVLPNGKQRRSDDAAEREEGDGEEEEEAENEDAAPSFGELLRGNEAIDVPSLLQQSAVDSVTRTPARSAVVPLPSHQSLTTVLTQALKTDDTELLESCLQVHDLTTVQNTIERIDTSLAGLLLNHLATRLHRRPGRAGNLMTWVQWTIVSHGGALASQPKVIHNLTSLQKVLAERARGLQSLLALKGKLDLLEGQMNLRRKMQQNLGLLHSRDAAAAAAADDDDDDDDDEHVIWVEGQPDSVAQKNVNGIRSRRGQDNDDDDDDDDDGLPLANGIGDSEDEEEDSDVDGGNDDDVGAAEELLDEDEVDHEDVDDSTGEEEEESDVDAAAPPSKMQKVGKSFTKRK
ncbi:Small-subunit processome, Utp12 [Moelleriella libera RCEF 2490]|uniref:Small-subunit processome, Utp12 n=1 Tax=Moelleriella libera RCEF 2490 TaxID=1081109 RepID=A0A168B9B4_9HYPO|nr:Small-subunit processome, Utp12 [Moelleriella libera RCEF 2490]